MYIAVEFGFSRNEYVSREEDRVATVSIEITSGSLQDTLSITVEIQLMSGTAVCKYVSLFNYKTFHFPLYFSEQ